ncbi:putative ATP-dependent RNA helicase kurz isoform X2 [Oratosquilla oratoria]|uniref:putative ATP-dependent RNA helicase kurz isoform X2 n=1 Tax=Oratosquilla oratoria TaxID=337810 RepID=UPI003F759D40
MGRQRQKYNWKARQISNTKVDESEQKKIKVENLQCNEDKFDESNALVLPSKKRKTKKLKDKKAPPVKLLSKKQRKKLEKIVDLKRKKSERSELLEALEKVKADQNDLNQLTQLQSTQTLGRKRFLASDYTDVTLNEEGTSTNVSAVKGNKRRKGLPSEPVEKNQDCNIVQLGEMSSDTDSETEDSDDSAVDIEDKVDEDTKNDDVIITCNNDEVKTDIINEESQKLTEEIVNEKTQTVSSRSTISSPIKPTFISVFRSSDIQTARLKLPILSEEQGIMEAIQENRVTVIVGTTGSGKTTQVPQFLYEAGYASNGKIIGVTEPRRIAAIAMSQRVGYEMNLSSDEISYHIRFENNTTPKTKIKFMTDGVLLKEIQADPMLKKYSVVIVDEAHERSVFSDILIGILSRIIPRREAKGNPLKLVIMSATLRIEDFTENKRLFNNFTPVIKVDARLFDVTVHYNKKTEEDYLAEAYKKVCKIHRQLPEGGILVFLTGQQEVNQLCKKLSRTFPFRKKNVGKISNSHHDSRKSKKKFHHPEKTDGKSEDKKMVLPNINLDEFVSALPDDTEGDEGVADIEEGRDLDVAEGKDSSDEEIETGDCEEQPMWVLPLFSMLPPEKQQQVFKPNPPGTRLCVVATNVAETSLTIPNVKYVVDSGKVKEKVYDQVTGVSIFHITWTSQASANQRAGRAGRTSAGHCYRLYSSAVFTEEFKKFSTAEIQRRPIDDLVLVMKSMNLPIVNFPFPTPPDSIQVQHSLRRLKTLGALEDVKKGKYFYKEKNLGQIADITQVTELGKAMSAFPLSPRFGKMLALSYQHSLLPYTVAIVSALTVQEVLVEIPLNKEEEATRNNWQKLRTSWAGIGNCKKLGDVMVLLCAVGAAEYQGGTRSWCEQNGLRYKAICEIRKLRRQLTNEINLVLPGCNLILDPQLKPPSDTQECPLWGYMEKDAWSQSPSLFSRLL